MLLDLSRRIFAGKTVCILAGGPSLNLKHVTEQKNNVIYVAINNSYLLAPHSDVLYFCDKKWFNLHRENEKFENFEGLKIKGAAGPQEYVDDPSVLHVPFTGIDGYDHSGDGVRHGYNSGYQAIHLSALLGAMEIRLYGFDMRFVDGKSHWHGGHGSVLPQDVYARRMLPHFENLRDELPKDVRVINCTPGSALKCFPFADGIQ